MSGTCSTDWRGYIYILVYEVFTGISGQNPNLEDIDVDGIKLLKLILKKLVGEFQTR
jgi:hypothetical protein